jgi:oligoribonuclease (3'-5' exoribonuclease)
MTLLDVAAGRILEVACIVTDSDLNIIAEGPDIVIHQPDDILQSMSEWCIKHHGMVKWLFFQFNLNVVTSDYNIRKFVYLCTSGCCGLRNSLLVNLCTS